MSTKEERALEEQANELLEWHAKLQGKSLRKLGIINRRRAWVIRQREIPLSLVMQSHQERREGTE